MSTRPGTTVSRLCHFPFFGVWGDTIIVIWPTVHASVSRVKMSAMYGVTIKDSASITSTHATKLCTSIMFHANMLYSSWTPIFICRSHHVYTPIEPPTVRWPLWAQCRLSAGSFLYP